MGNEKNILSAFNQLRQLLDVGSWEGKYAKLCAEAYGWIEANMRELEAVLKKKENTELKIVKDETEEMGKEENEGN